MLTSCQSDDIERMQRQIVKLCFGWRKSYGTICTEQDIKTLKERRIDYTIDNFIKKTVNNPRYKDSWYPLRDAPAYEMRDRRPFVETIARTSRYFNGPLSYLRRRANDLAVGTIT